MATIREWRLLVNGPAANDHGGDAHLYIRDDDGWRYRIFGPQEDVGDVRRFFEEYKEWPPMYAPGA